MNLLEAIKYRLGLAGRRRWLQAAAMGGAGAKTVYHLLGFDPNGRLLFEDWAFNLVVDTGLDDLLEARFKSSAYTASDFLGLTDGTPTIAPTDTMASHPGWVEVVAYSEPTRPAFVPGTVSGQSLDNSASKAVYTINAAGTTMGGIFLNTDATKGGATGILYGAAAFAGGDQTLGDGSTLQATATLTTQAV